MPAPVGNGLYPLHAMLDCELDISNALGHAHRGSALLYILIQRIVAIMARIKLRAFNAIMPLGMAVVADAIP